ncbi:MAG TPA: HAMP domain-containing sensor histidine kinase [Clostridia bacterium]|nr:HAMP domain-containing sensor histidine kinase [Clostridia bacterium]
MDTASAVLRVPMARSADSHGDESRLASAFAWFSETAGSLERSYGQLQSELARLRHELKSAQGDLEREREQKRKLEALAEMSAVLAHEIRNPLASLELFTSLLETAPELGKESHSWVLQMQGGLRTLSATVNNVLHFHNGPSAQCVPTHLDNLLRMTAEFLRPVASQSGVEIVFTGGLDGAHVIADPHQLQQVLLNLSLNAFRYAGVGGRLTIVTSTTNSARGNFARVEVRDTGCGMTPETAANIFEPGFTTRPGSAGLGLAVCNRIMQRHGGTIKVESEPGKGTTFVLTFPLQGKGQA